MPGEKTMDATEQKYRDPKLWSPHLHHHPAGSPGYVAIELLSVIDGLRAERDEARAKLASLVPGVVRIPEPAKVERTTELLMAYPVSADWGVGFDQGLAWARTHAEVVVEAVVLPDVPDRKTMDPDFDVDGTGMSDCDLVIRGYNLAVSRLRALQPQPATTREAGV
jgi:hypothetical protein